MYSSRIANRIHLVRGFANDVRQLKFTKAETETTMRQTSNPQFRLALHFCRKGKKTLGRRGALSSVFAGWVF